MFSSDKGSNVGSKSTRCKGSTFVLSPDAMVHGSSKSAKVRNRSASRMIVVSSNMEDKNDNACDKPSGHDLESMKRVQSIMSRKSHGAKAVQMAMALEEQQQKSERELEQQMSYLTQKIGEKKCAPPETPKPAKSEEMLEPVLGRHWDGGDTICLTPTHSKLLERSLLREMITKDADAKTPLAKTMDRLVARTPSNYLTTNLLHMDDTPCKSKQDQCLPIEPCTPKPCHYSSKKRKFDQMCDGMIFFFVECSLLSLKYQQQQQQQKKRWIK
ncbi:hypothetical protein RFI_28488 [Reticulomyxa filosa]|uniref:Uncharacterized protein n=1 Tax=Reticulomyxa filosa TaxID=46433 RepID=X6M4T0_RETFI|nr:hypothetical protein RFI_28488 [Reticulomyxa filosa]|eukprot:ETO08899.1 hypothetical protein RFI_28488 [Reticulomyxa filosa]